MDKNVLVEYADMKEELKDLERRIEEELRELDKLNQMIVTDSVTCGKKGKKPLRTVKIQGKPTMRIVHKQSLIEKRIMRKELMEVELLEKLTEAEEYIDSIQKSELRIMFKLYYIDNLTWHQVAAKMNQIFTKRRIKYTEDNCRMRHNRFLEKVS